jgi:hypothetical protein
VSWTVDIPLLTVENGTESAENVLFSVVGGTKTQENVLLSGETETCAVGKDMPSAGCRNFTVDIIPLCVVTEAWLVD